MDIIHSEKLSKPNTDTEVAPTLLVSCIVPLHTEHHNFLTVEELINNEDNGRAAS